MINKELNINNPILLGDLHFGIKNFSLTQYNNQRGIFDKQIFPKMEDKQTKYIVQLGDFFDNRTSANIKFISEVNNFFKEMVEKNVVITILLGNHDIYYRESLETSLLSFFEQIYPNNINLITEKTKMIINNQDCLIVPWITKESPLKSEHIKDVKYILGHFEIRNFTMVKGIKDTNGINPSLFKDKIVYSGHYHLKQSYKNIHYLGTPYQLNWNDHNSEGNGFYYWKDNNELEFYENISSSKFVKLLLKKNKLEIVGLTKDTKKIDIKNLDKILHLLDNHIIRLYLIEGSDFNNIIQKIEKSCKQLDIFDNRKNEIVLSEEDLNTQDPREVIVDTVKNNKPEVLPLLKQILDEIDAN